MTDYLGFNMEGNSIALTTSYGCGKKKKIKLDRVYKSKPAIPQKVMNLYQGKKGK